MNRSDFTFEQQVELAQLYYPDKWARAKTSKQRRNMRVAAVDRCISDYYRSLGRVCRTCTNYRKGICWMQSDFYGNVHVASNDTCSGHKPQ